MMRALRHVERRKLLEEVNRLDKVLPCVEINNITELNDTILACAILVTEKLEKRRNSSQRENQEPEWKERLRRKVENLKGDLSRIVECRKRACEDGMRRREEI